MKESLKYFAMETLKQEIRTSWHVKWSGCDFSFPLSLMVRWREYKVRCGHLLTTPVRTSFLGSGKPMIFFCFLLNPVFGLHCIIFSPLQMLVQPKKEHSVSLDSAKYLHGFKAWWLWVNGSEWKKLDNWRGLTCQLLFCFLAT